MAGRTAVGVWDSNSSLHRADMAQAQVEVAAIHRMMAVRTMWVARLHTQQAALARTEAAQQQGTVHSSTCRLTVVLMEAALAGTALVVGMVVVVAVVTAGAQVATG
jgi:hypothetical protein